MNRRRTLTHRRTFLKTLAAGGTVALTGIGLADLFRSKNAYSAPSLSGAVPIIHDFSVEAVLNSRLSYHSVGDDLLPEEVLANVLWAAGKAPVVGNTRRIFVATSEGVFEYDRAAHAVSLHKEGNQMSEPNIAFELAIAGDSALDAGAALQYAHLASIAFWASKNDQVACCTKDTAAQNARNTWDIDDEVQMANCYGRVSEVTGILTELVAASSDGSLAEPATDGDVSFEAAVDDLHLATEFADTPLSAQAIAQVLWASYGCTPHKAAFGSSNSPAGLTVASAVARYYLTERVYLVTKDGVYRYHNRLPNTDLLTRDHRLEQIGTDDVRAALCAAEPSVPRGAPAYIVFGSWEASNWSEVEAGFAGASALLQASSMGLAGHLAVAASADNARDSLSLPGDDIPLLIMALGTDAAAGAGGSGGSSSTTGGGGATSGTSSTTGGRRATGGTSSTTGGRRATGGTSSTAGGGGATGGGDVTLGGGGRNDSVPNGGTGAQTVGGGTAAGLGGATGLGGSVATGGAGFGFGGSAATGGSNGSTMASTGGRADSLAGAPASGAMVGGSNESGCSCRTADGSDASRSAALAGLTALLGFAFARRNGKRRVET
jgi:MYXO-CTERM domain-containing protein